MKSKLKIRQLKLLHDCKYIVRRHTNDLDYGEAVSRFTVIMALLDSHKDEPFAFEIAILKELLDFIEILDLPSLGVNRIARVLFTLGYNFNQTLFIIRSIRPD